MTCLTCQDKYYIFTFDTKSNEDEIQKCDDCNVFKTDKQASNHVLKGLVEGYYKLEREEQL